MKLIEALKIVRTVSADARDAFKVHLVCGFNPLHFHTFLDAQLRISLPDRRTEIETGLYGDFWGNLERLQSVDGAVGIVLLEWQDLDPRLGIRSAGTWTRQTLADIRETSKRRIHQLGEALAKLSKNIPVIISFPTLPLPPISHETGWQAAGFELDLRAQLFSLGATAAKGSSVRVASPQRLDHLSPLHRRLDVESELLTGFPYQLAHASALAEVLVRLVQAPVPKKGLITDLDDTVWKGILGEIGIEGVSWDLDNRSQMHAVYQQLLNRLSAMGVLLGIVSKNDPSLVCEALRRKDLILPATAIFPVEAGWGPKSESVRRILQAWNVGPDAVVFVDDSPMELSEVKASFPELECLQFQATAPEAIHALLYQLQDLFGKSTLSEEDEIRLDSIRNAASRPQYDRPVEVTSEEFLQQAEAELTLSFSKDPLDPRALELIHKTNQFNLNGRKHTEAFWRSYIRKADAFLLVGAYKDKYGPLGKIAVVAGRHSPKKLLVDTWVMSCRAFSRRIEHRCLEELFVRYGVEEIEFDFLATPRNGPFQGFLADLLGETPAPGCCLRREQFFERGIETFHRVQESVHG